MSTFIQIDDKPHDLYTFNAHDFSSKSILSSMYEPIFFEKDGEYKSFYVKENYKNNVITLEFLESYWSNGLPLNAEDMYKTLIYILKERTMFSSYLDFIVGVEEYLYDGDPIENVGIHLSRNSIYIETKYSYDYKKLFSTIQFSPIYFIDRKPVNNVSNGRFHLDTICNSIIRVKNNPFFFRERKVKTKELNFIYLDKLSDGIDNYKSNKLNMSCSTYFPFEMIGNFEGDQDFYMKNSNILFMLEISEALLPYKKQLASYVYDKLHNNEILNKGLNISDNYLFTNNLKYQKKRYKHNNGEYENTNISNLVNCDLNVLYADYYPNDLIVSEIIGFLDKNHIPVKSHPMSLKNFIKSYNRKQFDICLKLVSPLINSEIDLLLNYLDKFKDEKVRDGYIKLLNDYLEECTVEKKVLIDLYLENHSTIIPLYFGKHIYFQSKELSGFYIDNNDLYKFLEIE
ncbi:hypothetical protein [Bacillus multifaciens]|uniref:hypothetical protein n=1 Tax=Bacillus multifaciens TaxID=3068506 RepID=UPI0027403E62|nr:hypothetical protein [Bacillus sp. WLY-B-L8]MDP7978741.1 hypothetical protein [Bacillus sp. WLY-B-L8]HDX9591128.1 hypothetical protein [Bacillus pseudomycoides]